MALRQEGYRPRLVDSVLERRLKAFGAVEVKGTKFCGKTWTSLAHGASIIHLDDPAMRHMVELDSSLALEGELPHIIDEWQDVPAVWDATRRWIDETGNRRGQFILTGSSSARKDTVSHSGAGRIASLLMRPMSLLESGASTGRVSLGALFEGECATRALETDVRQIARLVCRGGWPASLDLEEEAAGDLPAQYLNALFEVSALKEGLSSLVARKLALSLARNAGKSVTYKTLFADTFEDEGSAVVSPAVYQQRTEPYVSFFREQYFIENLPGWDAPIKSRSRVRHKPKRTFVDPSLPAALLSMTPQRLLAETQVFGTLFEELCLRDVRVYASTMVQPLEPSVCYYSDADGLEVDIIIELSDGRWGAFEVKLSDEKAPEAERSLLRLRDKVRANPAARNPDPSFLAVLVGKASFCRRMPSGVFVIPITELGN